MTTKLPPGMSFGDDEGDILSTSDWTHPEPKDPQELLKEMKKDADK